MPLSGSPRPGLIQDIFRTCFFSMLPTCVQERMRSLDIKACKECVAALHPLEDQQTRLDSTIKALEDDPLCHEAVQGGQQVVQGGQYKALLAATTGMHILIRLQHPLPSLKLMTG